MAKDDHLNDLERESSGVAPRVISPRNAVNVAFPVSTIRVERPSRDVAELAALLAELAAIVDSPNGDLRNRAQDLASRLRR